LKKLSKLDATIRHADRKRTLDNLEIAVAKGERLHMAGCGTKLHVAFNALIHTRNKIGQICLEAEDCVRRIEEVHMAEVLARARERKHQERRKML